MSIILKALKKAESSSGRQPASSMQSYSSTSGSKLPIIIVAICTVALGFAFAVYIFKGGHPAPSKQAANNHSAQANAAAVVPADASSLNTEAIAQIEAGEYKEAETLLESAIKKYPDDPYLRNHLALALKKQGDFGGAETQYRTAIALKPDYYIAMNNLAVTLEAMGQKGQARAMYEKALEGDPSVGGAHLNYALLLEDEGKISEAEDHYHTFMTLSKDANLRSLVRRRLLALE